MKTHKLNGHLTNPSTLIVIACVLAIIFSIWIAHLVGEMIGELTDQAKTLPITKMYITIDYIQNGEMKTAHQIVEGELYEASFNDDVQVVNFIVVVSK